MFCLSIMANRSLLKTAVATVERIAAAITNYFELFTSPETVQYISMQGWENF